MGLANHVGRVGALAVALGVGFGIAQGPVAWATPGVTAPAGDGGTSDTVDHDAAGDTATDGDRAGTGIGSDDQGDDAENSGQVAGDTGDQPASLTLEDAAPEGAASSSDGTPSSTHRLRHTRPAKADAQPKTGATPTAVRWDRRPDSRPASDLSRPATETAPAKPEGTPIATMAVLSPVPASSAPEPRAVISAVSAASAPEPTGALTELAESILGTGGPVESPLSWVVLAAARRFGVADEVIARSALHTSPVQAAVAAAAPNLPPLIGTALFGTPNPVTGAVTGQIVANDPELKKLSFALVAPPAEGKLTFDTKTGAFTYTPSAAQRVLAHIMPGEQTVPFSVKVSDGVKANTQTVTVNVAVNPTQIADVGEVAAGTATSAVAVTDTRAYVTNYGAKSLTVIDTINRVKIADITFDHAPVAVAVTPDGGKVYVLGAGTNVITVLDGATNQRLQSLDLGALRSATQVIVSPDGKTLYVAGALLDAKTGASTAAITKVATTTGKIAGTVKLPGARPNWFTGIIVAPDGKNIYAIGQPIDLAAAATLYAFTSKSSTGKVVAGLGAGVTGVVVSPDSTRVYVADSAGTIAVLDSKTNAVLATVAVGQPGIVRDIAVSKDGTLLMVIDAGSTAVRVYDTRTPAFSLLGEVPTNAVPGYSFESVTAAMSPDGMELYFTGNGALQIVSLVPANAKPLVGAPSLVGPDGNGVVTGTVGVSDPNHDALTYTPSRSAKGTLVVRPDGTFIYTPTATARHVAATGVPGATTDTLTVTISDGRRGIVTQTITVTILPFNQIPVVKNTSPKPNSSTGLVKGAVTATDKDKDALTYTGPAGTLSDKGGTVTVDAKGRYAYTPTAQARYYASVGTASESDKFDTFTVTVDDGHGGALNHVVKVSISPKNTRPNYVVTSGGATLYSEQQGSVVVDPTVTVSRSDSPPLTGATATLGTPQTGDRLAFTAVAGSGITGSYDATTGVLTLTGTSSVANYQTALRSVTFASVTDAPAATRTVGFEVTDGVLPSAAATKTIAVTALNDAPSVAKSPDAMSYIEQQGAAVVDASVTVSDPDSPLLKGATATLAAPQTGDALAFTAPAGSGIKGSYNATTGVLTLTGTSSVANYQAALRSVTFVSVAQAPATGRTVSFVVTDGALSSAAAAKPISVIAVNDAPVLTGGGGNVVAAVGTPVKIAPTVTVVDADGGNLTGATVAVTSGLQAGADVLALPPQNGITASYNPSTGVLTLSGTASVANYQAALRAVTFTNATASPSGATRAVTITVTDGTATSNAITLSATVKFNRAPVAVNDAFAGAEDKPVKGGLLSNDSDADGDTVTASLGTGAGHGVVSLSGNGLFTYTPDVNFHGADSFTYVTSDGFTVSNTATVTLTITPVDDVVFQFSYGTGSQYWTPAAKAALQRAADRLSEYFATTSPVTVTYTVTGYSDPSVLTLATGGSGIANGAAGYHRSIVQEKILSPQHTDGNGSTADGVINWNFGRSYSYDDTPAYNETDFESVATHELLHTVGFISYLYTAPTANRYWFTYDSFVVDRNGAKVITSDYRWNTAYNGNLAGGNGGLYFNGANAVAAYGGLVPLQENAVEHLRNSAFLYNSANRKLMGPTMVSGTVLRTISPVEKGMLMDLGYTIAGGQPLTVALTMAGAEAPSGSNSDAQPASARAADLSGAARSAGRDHHRAGRLRHAIVVWYLQVAARQER